MKTRAIELTKSNDLYQVILALKQNRKKRNELDEIFVEGIESVKQALVSRRVELLKVMFADYSRLIRSPERQRQPGLAHQNRERIWRRCRHHARPLRRRL